VLGWQLDFMILEVFSSLTILRFYDVDSFHILNE